MDYICIGKIVNTHALKGEVRIISNFEYKERVFKIKNNLYVGSNHERVVINTYRKHKSFDMVTFEGINSINDVIKYKGSLVYIKSDDLTLNDDEILESEFTLYTVYNDNKIVNKITEYRCDNNNKMIRVNDKLIPYNKDFITKIDKQNKIIYMHDIGVFL